ncbi:MAG: MBL fold metallo-hydrolase [Myxococcales bacterium]|nr:MBL fold metallo-hydrolase [Myxococcales bacterium]
MRKLSIGLALLVALAAAAVAGRHHLLVLALSWLDEPVFVEAGEEDAATRWFDDYFTVHELDPRTFAIGEPRYVQQVFSYLIVGDARAVLFDAGPGHRDIRPVARSLTDRPITFVPSHFHYDHVGNEIRFDHVAVVDLPYLRERVRDGRLPLTSAEHLGAAEGFAAPALRVDEWLAPNGEMALGGRSLQVLHTPGHTEDSISLLDRASGQLFTGDFIYPGPLYAFLPNSGMGDYLQGAETVERSVPDDARLFGAHREAPPGIPELGMQDVADLRAGLEAIRDGVREGEGFYPVVYPINDRLQLLAEPRWLQDWTPRHPGGAATAAAGAR